MRVESICVAIFSSCQDVKSFALQLHDHEYSWVVKTPLGHHSGCGPMGLGQYNSIGEYCGPRTASSVFVILFLSCGFWTLSSSVLSISNYFDSKYPQPS